MMQTPGGGSDPHRSRHPSGGASGAASRRYGVPFSASNLIQAPLSALLEYSGVLRPSASQSEIESLMPPPELNPARMHEPSASSGVGSGTEVAIRIIGTGDQESLRLASSHSQPSTSRPGGEANPISGGGDSGELIAASSERQGGGDGATDTGVEEAASLSSSSVPPSSSEVGGQSTDGEAPSNVTVGSNSYQRYDIQQIARWIEQILPFSLLLLIVFIRQHLQGFFITIWISTVMFKSNDILRKQTALKGERKISVLVGIILVFMIHIIGIYWWYRNDDLLYPLIMLPPKEMPPFWHAIFIILVNDIMVRQAAMVMKCILLVYYKNHKGRNYRKQGQMLTLVEYLLLLYRSLLPTPVWYRFFLNKEYGSLFSSLTTGLYLTFKLTSVVEKVQSFLSSLKALSCKEIHYGSRATTEQVIAAGDLCAICQEKMHIPILLRCKHIFCEDCVSEWFERERTCPLCRALVKPAGLRSFGDGSTSLFFQLF